MRINKRVFIISIFWILINGFLLYHLGVKYAIDTARFDTEASAWINGTFEFSYHFWYSGYIAILALCKLCFHSIYPSILIQSGLSLISILLFYKGLCRILKIESTAFIAALLVILYIPIQQWNVCLLTESFYVSAVLLFVWAYSIENTRTKWITLLLVALIATILRPNGGILLITFFILIGKEGTAQFIQKYLYGFAAFALLELFFLLNTQTTIFYTFLNDSFVKGEIICGYSGWIVPVKSQINIDNTDGSIIKIIQLFITHPWEYLQLGSFRFIALWTDIRMYYSTIHNSFIVLMLLPTYLFAGIGVYKYRKIYSGLFLITILYAGLNSLLVMITYADWDGRFLAPLLPMIFIWSALGIQYIYKLKYTKRI